MDPALRELLRSGAATADIEAIIRLDQPRVDVAGVRLVARFGRVATCRLRPALILRTWHDENVVSLKRSRPLGPEPGVDDVSTRGLPLHPIEGDGRRPGDIPV